MATVAGTAGEHAWRTRVDEKFGDGFSFDEQSRRATGLGTIVTKVSFFAHEMVNTVNSDKNRSNRRMAQYAIQSVRLA